MFSLRWAFRLTASVAVVSACILPASALAAAPDREQAEARALVSEHFPQVWDLGYDRRLPMGRIVSPFGTDRVELVTSVNGVPQRVTSEGLFGYRAPDGSVRLIDTKLAAGRSGWSPASVGFGLTLPFDYADGVTWSSSAHGGVRIVPISANPAEGALVGADRDQVMWPQVWSSMDAVATVMGDGMREHLIARDATAPRAVSWRIALKDPKASLELRRGSVYVIRGKRAKRLMRAAHAMDAAGRSVSADFAVTRGKVGAWTLTLTWGAEHDVAGRWTPISWPVAIDPDLEVPMENGDIACDADGGLASAASNASSFWLEFDKPSSYTAGDYATCDIPGPSSSQGTWVSLTGAATWNSDTAGNRGLTLYDDLDSYEDATRYFDEFEPAALDLGASIDWRANAYNDAPLGTITASLDALQNFSLGSGSFARHFEIHNLVRTFRTPVLGSHPSIARTDVGAGFEVTHASGNVMTTTTDSAQLGFAGVKLELARSYNSLDPSAGIMGRGWISSYERRLEFDAATSDMVYVAADGRRWVFPSSGVGTWDRAEGQEATLQANADVATSATEPYELVYLDGRRERFGVASSGRNRLVREVWPMGEYVAYSGLSAVSGGSEFTISDGHGKELTGFVSSSNGRLTSVTDELNREWAYSYNGDGQLVTVTAPDSGVWTYTYNGSKLIATATDPVSRTTAFSYDAAQSAATVTDPGTTPYVFDYDPVNAETEVTFGTHVTTTYIDGTTGLAEETVDPEGESAYYEYNELGQAESAIDENGDESLYTYNSNGCMTSETDGEGNETTYADFDAFCHAETVTDAEGKITTYTFDADGNKLTMTTPSPDSQTTNWTYDDIPQPESMNPPAGATINYEYSDTGQLTEESWVDGMSATHYVTRSTYDDAGQQETTRQGDLAPTEFEYDGVGRLTKTTDPLTNYTLTTYDDAGQVVSERDQNGGVTEYEYDLRGNQDKVIDPLSNETETTFNQYGDPVTVEDALGRVTTTTFDKNGNELTVEDPLSRVTEYTYDDVGNQTSEEDPAGNVITYTFDSNGNEDGSTHPGPYTTSTTYTGLLDADTETDERSQTTTYGYDEVGREVTVTNAEGDVDQTAYDAAGRVAWRENGEDERTTYTLDPMGRVVETENPDTTTHRESDWDDAGREIARRDELGNETELTYDELGRVTSELRADGGVWEYTYDGNGNRLTEENAAGKVTTYTYDDNNRMLTMTDPAGGVTEYTYDEVGNLEKMTDPAGEDTLYEYDDADQRTKMIAPDLTETDYVYNSRGLLESETTGAKTTEYTYDARGNMLTVEQGSSLTTYTYDGTGNVLTHTMPDGTTISYTYDGVGRKTQEVHSIKGTTDWTYDHAGRITEMETPAGTTEYDYTANGLVEEIRYPGSMTVSFTYDDAGRLTAVTDWTGTRTYGRDDVGRVESFTTVQGYSGTNTFDTTGRKISSTHHNAWSQLVTRTWDYDDASRVETFTVQWDMGSTHTFSYTYTDDGRLETRTLPNGNVETYTYDDKRRLATQQLTGEPLITYTYDSQDRITKVEHTQSSVTTTEESYAYDSSGRLESWWHDEDWTRMDYSYDADGNLEEITRVIENPPSGTNGGGVDAQIEDCLAGLYCPYAYYLALEKLVKPIPNYGDPSALTNEEADVARYMATTGLAIRTYTHNGDGQLTDLANPYGPTYLGDFDYDARGNVDEQVGGITYTFDHNNRVKSRLDGTYWGDADYKFTYDGLWSKKSQANDSFSLDYDEEGKLLSMRASNAFGTLYNIDYISDPFGIAMMRTDTDSNIQYPYYNQRGDALLYHAQTGAAVSERYKYTPWGEYSGTMLTPYMPLYNGRDGVLPDSVSNHHLFTDYIMGARTYNAMMGRFRQADPVPSQEGLADTAYSYASNDPVNRVDPTGEASLAPGLVSKRNIRLNPRFSNHVWPTHSFEYRNAYQNIYFKKSYFNAYLSARGRRSKLKWLIKDCLDVFVQYNKQANGWFYVPCSLGAGIPGAIGFDRVQGEDAVHYVVIIDPVKKRLVTSFPVALPDTQRQYKDRVPVKTGLLSHSGVSVGGSRLVVVGV